MSVGSVEKIKYQTSARFHVIILITWILIDTRRSKNIQKNVKFVWKIRVGQINKILRKKMSIMKRAKQPFYQFYMFKTHTHADFL